MRRGNPCSVTHKVGRTGQPKPAKQDIQGRKQFCFWAAAHLEAALLKVLQLVLLQVEDDLGAAAQWLAFRVARDCEAAAGLRLPDVLHITKIQMFERRAYGAPVRNRSTQ